MLAILCLNSGMNAAGGTTENADPMAVGGGRQFMVCYGARLEMSEA
jgi:hypothetical protein